MGIDPKDSLWIKIWDCKNSKVLVGCFYRAPGVREEQERGGSEPFRKTCAKRTVLMITRHLLIWKRIECELICEVDPGYVQWVL